MTNPQQHYRLKSLASRGFYIPDIIPFEEVQSTMEELNFKHANNLMTSASNTPKRRKPGAKIGGKGRLRSLALQETEREELPGPPGSFMAEAKYDQAMRKGVR